MKSEKKNSQLQLVFSAPALILTLNKTNIVLFMIIIRNYRCLPVCLAGLLVAGEATGRGFETG